MATIQEPGQQGKVYFRRDVHWPSGVNNLPVILNLFLNDIEWPACVHVVHRPSLQGDHRFLPPISGILSGEVNPNSPHSASGWKVERRFFPQSGRPVCLVEDAADVNAPHTSDSSQSLAQVIDDTISLRTHFSPLKPLERILLSASHSRLNVIELGCGSGTVGLALAQAVPDCDVLLTDLDHVKTHVADNIACLQPAINSRAAFHPLDWTSPLPDFVTHRFHNLVIVSGGTNDIKVLQSLVTILSALVARSPRTVILVSSRNDRDNHTAFVKLMESVEIIQTCSTNVALPGTAGIGLADWATSIGVHVFCGKARRSIA